MKTVPGRISTIQIPNAPDRMPRSMPTVYWNWQNSIMPKDLRAPGRPASLRLFIRRSVIGSA